MIFDKIVVDPSEVDLQDHHFQITTPTDLGRLCAQIDAVGLLQLPCLVVHGDRYRIVSGFRRIDALLKMDYASIPAYLIKSAPHGLALVKVAIIDNTGQRSLNAIEQANAYALIKQHTNSQTLSQKMLTEVGLPDNAGYLKQLETLFGAVDMIKQALIDGVLALPTACQLASMPATESRLITELFRVLGVGLSKQRELLSLCHEICAREDISLQALLGGADIDRILKDVDGDRGRKIRRIRETLKERRYPTILTAYRKYNALAASLKLPGHMSLTPPPNLEGAAFSLTIRFESLAQFKQSTALLAELANSATIHKIINKEFDL